MIHQGQNFSSLIHQAYIEAPGCNLYGINKGESYLFEKGVFSDFDTDGCIFVCLDEHLIYSHKENHDEISFPLSKDFESILQNVYHNLNPYLNYTFLVLGINQGLRERKKLVQESEIYEYESKTEYYCIKVLEIF